MLIRSAELVNPTVGYPSVRNKKIFSPLLQGAPNSSLAAAFSILKAN